MLLLVSLLSRIWRNHHETQVAYLCIFLSHIIVCNNISFGFIAYFMPLSVTQGCTATKNKMRVNNELKGWGKSGHGRVFTWNFP
jgi:hypothetical protein